MKIDEVTAKLAEIVKDVQKYFRTCFLFGTTELRTLLREEK